MKDLFEELVRLTRQRVPCVLCVVVRTAGSTPRKSAARMLLSLDPVAPAGPLTQVGTIGGGRIEKEVLDAARDLLSSGQAARPRLLGYHLTHGLGMCCGGEMEVFLEPMVPEPPLVVCGGGHVARALVPLARQVGFLPILVEDLEELSAPARFPDADRIIDSFDVRDWKDVPLDDRTYVVIVTRDHGQDQALLEQLLPLPLAYLGLIGSRRKIAMFQRRLEHKGLPLSRWALLHAPIGLSIGAETPEEIAVAIVAELIQVRAGKRRPSEEPQKGEEPT